MYDILYFSRLSKNHFEVSDIFRNLWNVFSFSLSSRNFQILPQQDQARQASKASLTPLMNVVMYSLQIFNVGWFMQAKGVMLLCVMLLIYIFYL